jgi:hypothetical protein
MPTLASTTTAISPKSQTVFFQKALPAQITFVQDPHGKVTGGIHELGGRKLDVPRVEKRAELSFPSPNRIHKKV